jgi:hypothetical protein
VQNPFKPTFGASPPVLAGRDALLDDFVEALEDGPGSPGRATLYTGARGSGKTVMLNAVEDRARRLGWLVISETVTDGLATRLVTEHLPRLLSEHDSTGTTRRLTGVTAPLNAGGVSWSTEDRHPAASGLRSQIEQLTDILATNGTGLLITLDEVHRSHIRELREVATAVQHAFREEREVAFAAAGLAASVSDLLNDEVLTFLRRAERHHLGAVGSADVAEALRVPFEATGRHIERQVLEEMVRGTGGYPFLLQLVGYRTWRLHPATAAVSMDDARTGVDDARRRLGGLVHQPSVLGISEVDRSFLLAMAEDDGPTKMADIRLRLGVDASYASQYRLRLLQAELIESPEYGVVDFALPYLREYLREHLVTEI